MGRVQESKLGAAQGANGPQPGSKDDKRGRAPLEAIVFATTPSLEGGAAALLRIGETTPLARLLEQLAALGVTGATVVTRPSWERATVEAVDGKTTRVTASEDVSSDLALVASIARQSSGDLIIAPAHLVIHGEALVGILKGPRTESAILAGPLDRSPWSFPFRSTRGQIAAAGSPYHRVARPTNHFLELLKVGASDRSMLASSAEELSVLAGALPASWEEELQRKDAEWAIRAASAPGGEPAASALANEEDVELRHRIATSGAIPLLLVGLVRSNVALTHRNARDYFFAVPLSERAATLAAEGLTRSDEDMARLNAAVKNNDGFFTTFFVSPYSKYLARFAARRQWTPNAVTVVSFVIGLAAAGSFALGSRAGLVVGALLLQASFTVDCVDGQLARYTRTFSRLGAWLDSVFDRSKEYLVYAGLAVGSVRGFDDDVWILAAAALTLQTVRHLSDFSFMSRQVVRVTAMRQAPLEDANEAGWVEPLAPRKEPPSGDPFRQRAAYVAAGALRSLRRAGVTRWAGRILAFPIGERFALISLTAALFSPRVTFVAFLVWGGISGTYALLRRVMASYELVGRVARVVLR
jgi:phosphatidylglycerophosphate synthase